ncbi:MAG: glycosyltransferase family 9 protein, partial [Verrucomicrobiota bacterium]|nr:glycosyltransferase family 9 protein [Verrucomicrobiota bacterium]
GAAALVTDLGGRLKDFADTAAVIDQLDLVIAVDTAVAHLAGALGRPVWVVLSYAGDWRCPAGREDSPWYPTMRLFQQDRPADWDGVMERVVAALQDFPTPS